MVWVYLVGSYYAWFIYSKFDEDTTKVTNLGFGIVATLSALCFSAARAIEDEDRRKFRFAGERFLHASTLLILGSVVKYSSLSISTYVVDKLNMLVEVAALIQTIASLVVLFMFTLAIRFIAHALNVISECLIKRDERWD